MNPGQIYMLLALLSFGGLGVFHKLADVKHCRPSAITALLYLWSALFIFMILTGIERITPAAPWSVTVLALPYGVLAALAILAFQAGIRHGNIATSWLAINLSSGLPTIASILIYKERVTPMKAVALLLIPAAMLFLWKDKKDLERRKGAA